MTYRSEIETFGLVGDPARLQAGLDEQRELHEALLRAQNALGEAYVTVTGERIIFCNEAAERIAGRTLEELRALGSIFEIVPRAEQRVLAQRLTAVWQGTVPPTNFETTVIRPDGEQVAVEVGAVPFGDDDEIRLILVLRDIGERRRHEAERVRMLRRESMLSSVGQALERTFDLRESMGNVMRLLVAEVCDVAGVDVISRDGRHLDRTAVAMGRSAEREVGRELSRFPIQLDSDHPAVRVVRDRTAQFYPRFDTLLDSGLHLQDGHVAALRRAQIRSAAFLPLVVSDRCIGVLLLAWTEPGYRPSGHALELLEALTRRIAQGVANTLSFVEREEISSALQRSLLPGELPTYPGVELAARYLPADRGSEVGGDFYDVFDQDVGDGDGLAVVIGDVCGKGAEAAAVTAMARHTLRTALMTTGGHPCDALTVLNSAMMRHEQRDRFLTGALAVLGRPVQGVWPGVAAVAGHPPPIILRSDWSVELLETSGPLLGVFAQAKWQAREFSLRAGDMLIFYTDGVTEASRTTLLEPSRMGTLLAASAAGQGADVMADAVVALSRTRGGGLLRDDVAVVVVRVG